MLTMSEYSQTTNSEQQKLTGVGGWLVLVIIGLFASVLWNIYDLTVLFDGSMSDIDLLGSHGADTNSFYLSLFIEAIWVVMKVVFLVLIFSRNVNTRTYAFIFYGGMIVTTLAYIAALSAFASSLGAAGAEVQTLTQSLTRGIGSSIIWIIYWARSKRVKYTFSKAAVSPPPMEYSQRNPFSKEVLIPPPVEHSQRSNNVECLICERHLAVLTPPPMGHSQPSAPPVVYGSVSSSAAYIPPPQTEPSETPPCCERCGSRLPDEGAFCENCGAVFSRQA
jgi:hypothetical protein